MDSERKSKQAAKKLSQPYNTENKKPEVKAKAKKPAKKAEPAKPLNSIEIIENRITKEVKDEKRFQQSFQVLKLFLISERFQDIILYPCYNLKDTIKQKLIEDNKREEKEIAKLAKLLHIKKDSKKHKQSFIEEGFADLLDFCDEDKRKEMVQDEGQRKF